MASATFTADKGYYCVEELEVIQDFGIKTGISDPLCNRRVDKLGCAQRAVVRRARRTVKSGYGKTLLRRQGMYIERSFAHILDSGGMRRTTFRGQTNLDKRYKIAMATYNLSQLMRHLFRIGTPKQAAARVLRRLMRLLMACLRRLSDLFGLPWRVMSIICKLPASFFRVALPYPNRVAKVVISTGC